MTDERDSLAFDEEGTMDQTQMRAFLIDPPDERSSTSQKTHEALAYMASQPPACHAGGPPHPSCPKPEVCVCCCNRCLPLRRPEVVAILGGLGFETDVYGSLRQKRNGAS